MMHGLYYADEVRGFDEVEFGDAVELKKGELELAGQLIEQLSSPRFEPAKYEDDYRRELARGDRAQVRGRGDRRRRRRPRSASRSSTSWPR